MASSQPEMMLQSERPPMVGRKREQAQLDRLLEWMLDGQGSLVLVSGEAGIGKTTLVDALCKEAEGRGCLVLSGGCYDLTTTPPYGPWTEILFRRYRPEGGLPPLPDPIREGDLSAIGSQPELFDLVLNFVTEVAEVQPLIVVLEDLHWSDEASLDTLRWVGRWLGDHRILIVATYRDDEITRRHPLHRLLPMLVRESGAERVTLRALDTDAVRALVVAQYELSDDDVERLTEYLDTLGEGNPLFVGELLRGLEDDNTLEHIDGSWRLGRLRRGGVPPMLQQVIDGRLSRLSADAYDALQTAAVIGQGFAVGRWAAVLDVAETDLAAIIDEALYERVLEEDRETDTLQFRHALIREALYASLTLPHRRARHGVVAEVLMSAPNADPDAVVHHLGQAGDERATTWLIRAGFRAEQTYAWHAAIDRFERVITKIERRADHQRLSGWLLFRLGCLLRLSDVRRALAYFGDARRVGADVGDSMLEAVTRYGCGILSFATHDIAAGYREMAAAIEALEHLPVEQREYLKNRDVFSVDTLPPDMRAAYVPAVSDNRPKREAKRKEHQYDPRGVLAAHLLEFGRIDDAARWIEPLVETDQSRHVPQFCRAVGATILGLRGQPVEADRQFRLLWSTDSVSPMYRYGFAYWEMNAVVLPYRTNDIGARRRLMEIADEAATQRRDVLPPTWSPHFGMSSLHELQGEWNKFRSWVEQADLDEGRAYYVARIRAVLGSIALRQGDQEVAQEQVLRLLPSGPETAPGHVSTLGGLQLQRTAAQLALDAGDFELAKRWIEATECWLGSTGIVIGRAEAKLLWARYHLASADADNARQCADQALDLASAPRQPLALIEAHRFIGELDISENKFDDAQGHLDTALTLADACLAPYEIALCQLAQAKLALGQGDGLSVRKWMRPAKKTLERLDACPALARLNDVASHLTRLEGRTTYPAGLTKREAEVLRLVAEGLSDAKVADRLYISPRTVSTHLKNIYRKLDIHTRAEATRFAVEQGLTDSR